MGPRLRNEHGLWTQGCGDQENLATCERGQLARVRLLHLHLDQGVLLRVDALAGRPIVILSRPDHATSAPASGAWPVRHRHAPAISHCDNPTHRASLAVLAAVDGVALAKLDLSRRVQLVYVAGSRARGVRPCPRRRLGVHMPLRTY